MRGTSASLGVVRPSGHLMTVAMIFSCSASVWAASPDGRGEPDWYRQPYPYTAVDQPVRDVLVELGRNLNVPIRVEDQLNGNIRGKIIGTTAGDFLDSLASTAQLVWYYDGAVLHV